MALVLNTSFTKENMKPESTREREALGGSWFSCE